jgi:hypothetical protein
LGDLQADGIIAAQFVADTDEGQAKRPVRWL